MRDSVVQLVPAALVGEQFRQLLPDRDVVRPFSQHLSPLPLRFGQPPLLAIDLAQKEMGLVALHPLVRAGEVDAGRHRQQLPKLGLGPAQIALVSQQDRLPEQQFGFFGELLPSGTTRGQGLGELAELVVRAGDECPELAEDAVIGVRQLQAAAQVGQRLGGLAPAQVDRGEVEMDERLVWLFLEFQEQEAQVPLHLAFLERRLLKAGVVDDDVGMTQVATGGADRRQDLLVDAVLPADRRVVTEQADVVDDRGGVRGGLQHGALGHRVGHVRVRQLGEEGAQAFAVRVVQALVGVQPKNPVAGGVAEALVAGGGEAVTPHEVVNPRTQPDGNLARLVRGACVHHNYLTNQILRRTQTTG